MKKGGSSPKDDKIGVLRSHTPTQSVAMVNPRVTSMCPGAELFPDSFPKITRSGNLKIDSDAEELEDFPRLIISNKNSCQLLKLLFY